MTRDSIIEKFSTCVYHPVQFLNKKKLDSVVKMIDELENLDDVGQLVRLLS